MDTELGFIAGRVEALEFLVGAVTPDDHPCAAGVRWLDLRVCAGEAMGDTRYAQRFRCAERFVHCGEVGGVGRRCLVAAGGPRCTTRRHNTHGTEISRAFISLALLGSTDLCVAAGAACRSGMSNSPACMLWRDCWRRLVPHHNPRR